MHIAGAEQRYVRLLSDRQPTYGERDGWPDIDVLRQALDESGHTLIDLASGAQANHVIRAEYQGQLSELPVFVVYVQAINHATEHRSQMSTILTQQGVEPPTSLGGRGATPSDSRDMSSDMT